MYVASWNLVSSYDQCRGTGTNAVEAWQTLFPACQEGGPEWQIIGGDCGGHLEEECFKDELMTPTLNTGAGSKISSLTLGYLDDIGYTISTKAPEFTIDDLNPDDCSCLVLSEPPSTFPTISSPPSVLTLSPQPSMAPSAFTNYTSPGCTSSSGYDICFEFAGDLNDLQKTTITSEIAKWEAIISSTPQQYDASFYSLTTTFCGGNTMLYKSSDNNGLYICAWFDSAVGFWSSSSTGGGDPYVPAAASILFNPNANPEDIILGVIGTLKIRRNLP